MKHTTKILTLFGALLISSSAWAVDATYYTSLDGKNGKNLFDAIHAVAKVNYKSLTYSGLWTAYQTTDLNSTGKIWDMYGGCDFTYSTNQCGSSGYSKECDCYNREHSIPKSWFGGTESANTPGTDIFHVVPTDGKVNGMRSNNAFGEVESATYTYNGNKLGSAKSITLANSICGTSITASCSSSPVFEPIDEYKGDFARGYMGTLLRWANGDYQAFTTGEGASIFSGDYTETGYFGLTQYGIALLMKWHRQDPVSQKEIDRNNGIEAAQGNRNPFIDYPCLAEYLWGNKAGETFSTASCCGSFEANFSVGSDGCTACATAVDPSTPTITVSGTSVECGSVVVGNTTTATFTVSGSNLTADITLEVTGTGFSIDQTTLAPTDGTVAATTITVTFTPTAAGEQNGTITISSTGATNKTVSLRAVGATAAVAPAPSTTPVVFFGTVVTEAHIFSGTTATLHLHISDLATDVTVESSNTGIFTVSTDTKTDGTITPDEAAAGVTITLEKGAAGTANLIIKSGAGGVVDKTYAITFQ